ncbi:hypothetical protein ColLi_09245 [Colletotrichum liriopes]|uniref:ubiquitinyl hydrolase 1 n=1 Tax=Colletotrichum liriopes TaxID=708192 RepID=A0AA37GT08_9PEZI|nr:hypothetical protein ColLi_09245 [Colletotrichum liriopes]
MATQTKGVRDAVFVYISKPNLTTEEINSVEGSRLWSASTKNTVLLLRGLIALQVLAFVFCQKRWRVDYGLDPNRDPSTRLAVPFRAKDNPTARAEFSHPDVIITLTSLSYYYEGLTDDDLFLNFNHLVSSDQADMEYCVWVADSNFLPPAFRQLSGINLEDRPQCIEQVFPCLKYAKAVVDYFLEHIVFPRELKEFPDKLSASGWDLGEEKPEPTTGFSGTNDSRAFLPLTVSQLNEGEQQHTNALVLEYLLQDENSVALTQKPKTARQSEAEALLEMVTQLKPPVRVILDVGAQILELDNLEVARRWLQMMDDTEDTQAVIFCDENDQTCVVDRQDRVEMFLTSPFANKTDVCLVFLDEAHTRGTDLKLPLTYRAAVTLGANLTKDRLVQACMRMRKLGKGQSVIFCVPEEIQQKINPRLGAHKPTTTVVDILEWAISETFSDLRRGIRLWANQGQRQERQKSLWAEAHVEGSTQLGEDANRFLEVEAQTLEKRYRPTQQLVTEASSSAFQSGIDAITERLLEFGSLDLGSSTFQEEQERELSPEVEQERQIQRPPPADPAVHSVHLDIRRFVSQGVLTAGSKAYMPAFMALADTSAAQHFDVRNLPQGFLVTADFVRTIVPFRNSYLSDLFQRSVQWILTSASDTGVIEIAIIISPYEAHELLPEIRLSKRVSLHLYAPRLNMGLRPLDSLDLYTVPHRAVIRSLSRRLTTELSLFSGQLYVDSLEEYANICEFLGLSREFDGNESNGSDQTSSWDIDVVNEALVQFMKVFMTKIRRNCESIDKTHGKALHVTDNDENGDSSYCTHSLCTPPDLFPDLYHNSDEDSDMESNPAEEAHGLAQLLEAARRASVCSGGSMDHEEHKELDCLSFPLSPRSFGKLGLYLDSYNVDHSRLRFEYYPDCHQARLKIAVSAFHEIMATGMQSLVEAAATQHVAPMLYRANAAHQIRSENGHITPYYADRGWSCSEVDIRPCLVLEVGYSQTPKDLTHKAEEYIPGSSGSVCA